MWFCELKRLILVVGKNKHWRKLKTCISVLRTHEQSGWQAVTPSTPSTKSGKPKEKNRPEIPNLNGWKVLKHPWLCLSFWWISYLHIMGNFFPVREDLGKVLSAQNIPESSLCQKTGRWVGIGDVCHCQGCVLDAVIDHTIHTDRHWVLREDLKEEGSNLVSADRFLSHSCQDCYSTD